MAISLCASYFPLLSSLQDLEERRSNGFFIESTRQMENPSSLLRSFLLHGQDGDAKLGCDNRCHGYTFVEVAYATLNWCSKECKVLSVDILSDLIKALLTFARASTKSLEDDSTTDLRKLSQNNLRICIFYLCHGISITEGNILSASGQSSEVKKVTPNIDGVRWLELKTAAVLLLWKVLQSLVSAFDVHQEVMVAGALIRTTAIACLVHQKWGDRAAVAKTSLSNLKKALLGILGDPFLHPLPFAPEVSEQAFGLLMTLCAEHKNLISFMVDMIAELVSIQRASGLALLSKLVHGIKSLSNASVGGKGSQQVNDECDLALTMVADFAVRKDAVLVLGLYLGHLLPVLQSDRAAARKHVVDIIVGCLPYYHVYTLADQQALVTLLSFLLRDRDATCRLKALTGICSSLKENSCITADACYNFISIVLRRVTDKSKTVRLKALQSLAVFFSKLPVSTSLGKTEHEVVAKVSKLLQISADSPYFCKETFEAAGKVLCTSCLKGPSMVETLDVLLSCEHSSAKFPVILKVLHFHLDGYDQWLQFLAAKSDESVKAVERFLVASVDEQSVFSASLHSILKQAHLEVLHQTLDDVRLLGSLRMIFLFMSLDCVRGPQKQDICQALVTLLNMHIDNLQNILEGEKQLKSYIIKWLLKALALLLKKNRKAATMEVFEVLERKLVDAYNEGIEGCVDCIYSIKNPHTLTRKILHAYEERLQVLDSPQPFKVLRGYLIFIGDLSKSYQFACDAFIKRLREAQKHMREVPASCAEGPSDFDYLQQEEQKAQEEDAVLRFAHMLLDGDSMPGCYVPFLHELASCGTVPTFLRTTAIQSLGHYMLSNIDLAEKYRLTLEALLQDEKPEIKLSALFLAEKLILAFPNNYLPVLDMILPLFHDDVVKCAAFSVYANLILERKFKLDVLLGPICSCICDNNEKICSIARFLLKRLVQDAGKAKHKLLLSLWNHCTNLESHKKLATILVDQVLDATDLQSDELASSVLQILALGQNGVAFLASFLHPSFKVLQTLDFYLSSSPPKINLKGESQTSEYLSQFVKNCRRLKAASAAEKELIGRLLEKLQRRSSRKRKGLALSSKPDGSTYSSLVDYEKAIESFKQCEVTNSLWELLRHDI
ncbi:hypothetical protein GOP47_0006009 [Adiantum capillus-veneris]|uniref:Uncharacterized protein n=1 Tax=Adiantum capillus-veneris TaxID=13818 RepID=A0A9D4ZJX4_ADICA|nr:hypothetical protein GOP47_0006009 [Adiantum capillus-veneris]